MKQVENLFQKKLFIKISNISSVICADSSQFILSFFLTCSSNNFKISLIYEDNSLFLILVTCWWLQVSCCSSLLNALSFLQDPDWIRNPSLRHEFLWQREKARWLAFKSSMVLQACVRSCLCYIQSHSVAKVSHIDQDQHQ